MDTTNKLKNKSKKTSTIKSNIVFYSKTLLTIISILLISLISTSCKSKTSDLESITVMSYNIHYGYGMDKKYDLSRIANIILNENADIVGVQEISDSIMASELGRLTNMHVVFGPSKDGKMNEYGDLILSKYPFEWVGNVSIPSASSSRYQAMAVDIDLSEIYGEGSIVRFINTHFDWMETIGSEESRLAAVEVIEKSFLTNTNLPAIFTADLNANPDTPTLQRMGKYGWVNKYVGMNLNTYIADDVSGHIDYVLFRPEKRWSVDTIKVLDEPIASDHLPIIMKLKLLK